MRSPLFRVHARKIYTKLLSKLLDLVHLVVVLHLIVETLFVHHSLFLVLHLELLDSLTVLRIMNLESTCLDLVLPYLVVNLNVI